MNLFQKKPQPSRTESLEAFRTAIYDSKKANEISRNDFIAVLEGIAANEKMYAAVTMPLQSATPRMTNGSLPEPRTPFRDLARKIAGTA